MTGGENVETAASGLTAIFAKNKFSCVVAVIPLTGEMSRSGKRVLFSEKIPRPQNLHKVYLIGEAGKASLVKGRGTASAVEGFLAPVVFR